MNIAIKKLTKTAKIPTRKHSTDAGYDLYADIKEKVYIDPNETKVIGTGLAMAIPEGYFGGIYARSGKATKEGIRPSNCVGVIDANFRGEIKVALHNDFGIFGWVEPGERVAQIIIQPVPNVQFCEVDVLDETDRGEGGFGSSGRM